MDLLKAEIERKRKQLKKDDLTEPGRKFFKRGDLAAKQTERYWKKYYEKHGQTAPATDTKPVTEADALDLIEKDSTTDLPRGEVVRRLRERSEPILEFGETEHDALRRLRKLEIDNPDLKPGWRNDFQAALDQVDQDFVNEVIQGTHKDKGKHDIKVEEEKLITVEEIQKMAPDIGEGEVVNVSRDAEVVYAFLNMIMQRWARDLNARDENVKSTPQGKFQAGMHRQTIGHTKTLFQQLKNKSIASDILTHLGRILKFLLNRDYIRANNAYMELAIGNAPWPVGVTRSGIHQRPGSAKSYVANIAHVLNDETQRKYIQGLKRIMTRCQQYYPTDPSKSVEFAPNHKEL